MSLESLNDPQGFRPLSVGAASARKRAQAAARQRKRRDKIKAAERHAESRKRRDGSIRRDMLPGYPASAPTQLRGRPPVWSDESRKQWQSTLIEALALGQTLAAFVANNKDGPSAGTFIQWRGAESDFALAFERARECGADMIADEVKDIADEIPDEDSMVDVNRSRLRADSRKWLASKLAPKRYADRVEQVASGNVSVTITDDDRARALALIMSRELIRSAVDLPSAQRMIEAQAVELPLPAEDKA